MKVLSCLYPKVVFNRSLGRNVIARCGKCFACLNARAANWVQRLDQEIYFSPYTFFVTFQYDEYHVNQFVRLRDEDNPFPLPSYIDSLTGQVISLSECSNITPKDVSYCEETKVLLVPSVRDFQLFLKKLRQEIKLHYGNARLRYYNTFEVGPTTFRPHSHCLFFLSSSLLAQDFKDLCHKYWTYGNAFDPHIVHGSASQYVASYVNCLSDLPAIYLHPQIRPKSIFSKCPPIGFPAISEQTRNEIFKSQSFTFTLFKKASSDNVFVDVPLWRSLRNSLYRFIVKFDDVPYGNRIALYRLGSLGNEPIIDDIIVRETIRLNYYRYFYTWNKDKKTYMYNEDSFQRFKRCVTSAYRFCLSKNISIEYYVYLISEFYDKSQLNQLKNYFLAQQEYFKNNPASDLLLLDVDFCRNVNGKMYEQLFLWQKYYLDIYLPDIPKNEAIHLDYKRTFSFTELYKLHEKIANDNTKTKYNYDYLMAHSEQFQNIINYKFH